MKDERGSGTVVDLNIALIGFETMLDDTQYAWVSGFEHCPYRVWNVELSL